MQQGESNEEQKCNENQTCNEERKLNEKIMKEEHKENNEVSDK